MRPVKPCRNPLASLLTLLSFTALAPAASLWTGAVDSNYNTAGNWTPSGLPGVGTDVEILSGTANIPSGNWSRNGSGYTTIGGTAAVNLTTGSARLVNFGVFNMQGGSFTQTGEYFLVGSGGVGTMNHSGGTITSTLSRGFQLSDNNINQSGTVYNLSGTASLIVKSTATFTDANLRGVWFGKGGESGGNSSVPIGTATGDIFHATGGTASFTRTGTNSSEVRISRNSCLIIDAGAVSFNNYSEFRVGQGASGGTNARIVVNGGTLDITGLTTLYLGESDSGLLDISGGTTTLAGLLSLGRAGFSGAGTVNMDGGILSVGDIAMVNGIFHFDGGDLYLNGDKTGLISQTWFDGTEGTTASFDGTKTHVYVVPESSVAVLLLGLGGLVGLRRRRI